jgi:hypothetical protein
METLPMELLKLIGLQLPLCQLSLVNKNLASIYEEDFYKLYLEYKYPTVKLWKRTSYKDLCARTLRQGVIHNGTNNKKITKGIKAGSTDYGLIFVLTFNGELYTVNKRKIVGNKNKTLVSNNVVDFDCETYITPNKWYFFKSNLTVLLIMESLYPFTHVAAGANKMFVTTDHNIYACKIEDNGNLETNGIIGKRFDKKIAKMISMDGNICLLFSDGHLLVMSEDLAILAEASEVLELYPYMLNWNSKYYLFNELFEHEIDRNCTDNGIFHKKDICLITELLEIDYIKNCIDSCDCSFLSNGRIYRCTYDSSIKSFDKRKICHQKQIKNITGNWRGIYLIY